MRIKGHLCTDQAISFIERVRPEVALFIHLGIVMIRTGPEQQAEKTEKATGVTTIALRDRTVMDVGEDIVFHEALVYEGEWIPDSSP
jgi:phosphoribosyl 1,2-cyclic phosphodiesterase